MSQRSMPHVIIFRPSAPVLAIFSRRPVKAYARATCSISLLMRRTSMFARHAGIWLDFGVIRPANPLQSAASVIV